MANEGESPGSASRGMVKRFDELAAVFGNISSSSTDCLMAAGPFTFFALVMLYYLMVPCQRPDRRKEVNNVLQI